MEALQTAIEARGGSAGLTRFYTLNDWDIAWSGTDTDALDHALANRSRHGLDNVGFFAPPAADASAIEQDVARTAAALAYASALSRGYSDPRSIHLVYTIPRPQIDVASGLVEALREDRVNEWLEELAPQDDEYRMLSAAYTANSKAAGQETEASRDSPSVRIRIGDADPRVPEIARQLAVNGYLPERVTARGSESRFTPEVAAALNRFQRDYGIAEGGMIGPATRAALVIGPAARNRAVAVAMERRRWLTREPPETRIDVDIDRAEMTWWRDGKPVDRRKVIVGRTGDETPQLQTPMFRLVANPTWTVPRSIQNTELAGKSATELQARGMTRKDGWIVQEPGPKNALGQVKFDMRNEYAIYLHDTPAKTLFSQSHRQLSHGCVRVSDALGFAALIAQQEGIGDEWEEARRTGKERFVKLPREIPVRLLYRTATVRPGEQPQVQGDPYGWDERVAEALGFASQAGGRFKGRGDDFGP